MKKNKNKREAQGIFRSEMKVYGTTSSPAIKLIGSVEKKLRTIDVITQAEKQLLVPSYYKWPEPKPFRPTANALSDALTTKFLIDLFIVWTGTKILDTIWDLIKSDVKKALFGNNQFEMRYKFHLNDCTLIVIIHASSPNELTQNKKLVSQAFKFANIWVESKGFTHKYIIFNIKDGRVSNIPVLRNEL